MYELVKVGRKTYYIDAYSKVGVYLLDDNNVCLIDSGNDKGVAKKILATLSQNSLKVKVIINTHSHADHIGGNSYIQSQTDCEIYAYGVEQALAQHTILEPAFFASCSPFNAIMNKFFYADSSNVKPLSELTIDGLSFIHLPGHSFDQIAILTDDNILFTADAVMGEEVIEKYHLFYLYDPQTHINSLNKLIDIKADLYIGAHIQPQKDIGLLAQMNINKVNEVMDYILSLCKEKTTFEIILKKCFEHYELKMNFTQYYIIGATVNAYLSNLSNSNKIKAIIEDNVMYWEKI